MNTEPLLTDESDRLVLFPIRNQRIWALYKKAVSMFWTAEEVDLSKDRADWDRLSDADRAFLSHILAFFGASDTLVNANLGERFLSEVGWLEAKCLYGFQLMIENIHSEVYSLLIDTYITDPVEKDRLFNSVANFPCIARKIEWCRKWIQDDQSAFAKRLVAFAIVEGVYFSGSFAGVFFFKERGVLPGLTFSNELISRDEGLHVDTACLLFEYIRNKPTQKEVHAMVREAVEIETEFVVDSLKCDLVGMNSTLMIQYIQYVADRLLKQLGYETLYGAVNPFPFMDRISMATKTNFFESRVAEYAKAKGSIDFSLDETF